MFEFFISNLLLHPPVVVIIFCLTVQCVHRLDLAPPPRHRSNITHKENIHQNMFLTSPGLISWTTIEWWCLSIIIKREKIFVGAVKYLNDPLKARVSVLPYPDRTVNTRACRVFTTAANKRSQSLRWWPVRLDWDSSNAMLGSYPLLLHSLPLPAEIDCL